MRSRLGPVVAAAVAGAVLCGCAATADVTTIAADPLGGEREVPPPTSEPAAEVESGTIDWRPCTDGAAALVELQCGTVEVPLDHADPDGEVIEIALARQPASGSDRIGSLLFNPGGPGGSGVEFLPAVVTLIPTELAERFDLVSFDPRGVGSSTAIECDIDFDDHIALLEEGDDAGWDVLVGEALSASEMCSASPAELASYVGTDNAARDLDLLRDALGDVRLSYVGFSYGTRLGATYAELFPDRVRALVLDGAVKPTDDQSVLTAEQAPAFDRAFDAFATACDADPDCALDAIGPSVEVYEELAAEIDGAGSLPTDDPERSLSPGELRLAVAAAMYTTDLWPILADALADAASEGDGTLLQALVDTYVGRRPDGSYDNSQVAGSAINCADDPSRPPADEVRRQSEAVADETVWFGDWLRADTGCLGLPEPIDPITIGPAEGADPILVIGTTGDPATPYEWAVELADFLDDAVLFTVEDVGHTAFLSEPCVHEVVVRYLVDLELPAEGESCAPPPSEVDAFPPPGESEFDQIVALFDCLREAGADVPELTVGDLLTDPDGSELLDALDPSDPAFAEAALICVDEIPSL